MWLMSWPIYMNVLAVANFPYPAAFHSVVQEAGQCSYTHVIPQRSGQCSYIQKYREGVPKTPRGSALHVLLPGAAEVQAS